MRRNGNSNRVKTKKKSATIFIGVVNRLFGFFFLLIIGYGLFFIIIIIFLSRIVIILRTQQYRYYFGFYVLHTAL